MLTKYVYPRWKDRPFLEIRRGDVNNLLDHVADSHGLSQADAVLAQIRGIMTWYQTRDEDYVSPIVRGMRRNEKRKARDRTLNDDELRAVWRAAEDCGTFGAFVKVALLTAQRRDKIATMKWSDITDGIWTIAKADEREKGTAGKEAEKQKSKDGDKEKTPARKERNRITSPPSSAPACRWWLRVGVGA